MTIAASTPVGGPRKNEDSHFYRLSPEAVEEELKVEPGAGLSTDDANERLQHFGPNRLSEREREPGWKAFLRQYNDLMQLVLLGAAVVNQVVTGETGTTLVLIGLTIFNAVLALNQESKAEAAL